MIMSPATTPMRRCSNLFVSALIKSIAVTRDFSSDSDRKR